MAGLIRRTIAKHTRTPEGGSALLHCVNLR